MEGEMKIRIYIFLIYLKNNLSFISTKLLAALSPNFSVLIYRCQVVT